MNVQAPDLSSESIAGSSGSNFIASFWFLPREKRLAMNTIYAFCKMTDDIVDVDRFAGPDVSKGDIQMRLEAWRDRTLQACRGDSGPNLPPVLSELAAVQSRYNIPESYFLGLIEGCQMDLEKKSYKTFDELYQYCYRVASLVGLMCLEIFGSVNQKSKDYAVDLGVAFQLTNILRDIRTDLLRGRIYIPEEDLARFRISRQEFLSLGDWGQVSFFRTRPDPNRPDPNLSSKFLDLMSFEIARAEKYYLKAGENLKSVDRPNLIAAEVMTAVYHALLEKIRKDPIGSFKSEARLPRWKMILKIFQGWAANRLEL